MRKALLAVFVAAIGCQAERTTSAPHTSIQGLWVLNYTLANSANSVSCVGGGQVILDANETTISGSSHAFSRRCVSPRDTTMESLPVTISGGQRVGASISFSDSRGCTYTGTVSESRLAGQVGCWTADPSTPVYSGSWIAMRPLPD